ncbi:hypothetical protein A4S05_05640 [Nostoc sp. KVJ20]|nr:hypothetical protein A4S05_05640 [Nostoc sp. KVJ20]
MVPLSKKVHHSPFSKNLRCKHKSEIAEKPKVLPHPNPPLGKGRELNFFFTPLQEGENWISFSPFARGRELDFFFPPWKGEGTGFLFHPFARGRELDFFFPPLQEGENWISFSPLCKGGLRGVNPRVGFLYLTQPRTAIFSSQKYIST